MGYSMAVTRRPSSQVADERKSDLRPARPHRSGHAAEAVSGGARWSIGDISLFPIQPKLEIGSSNDPLEREADGVAERVMRMPDPDRTPSQRSDSQVMHRMGDACKEEDDTHEKPFRKERPGTPAQSGTPAIVDEVLHSPGQPIDPVQRAFFEPRFGHDFSKVRTHTDGTAASAARSIGATAFAVGQHIAFGVGQYRPRTAEGRKLIAHELAHVVQQGAGVGPVRRQSSLDTALAAHDYQQIAEILNGYSWEGIQSELAKRSRGFAAAVYSGAIENKRVGPDSAIAQATRPAYLDINYENEVARKDWQAAAFYFNGFNAKDIIDRLAKRTTEEVQALRDGAVAHPQVGPGSQLARLAGDEAARRERQGKRPPEPEAAVPMGGAYEDYAADPDYVDNFSSALYDPFSKSMHLFYPDGGEAVMPLPIGKASSLLVFERKSFLDTPTPKDFKVYPTILTRQNIPHIADWLADHKEETEQSDLLLQAGVGSLQARSLPPDLWWLVVLAPAAGLGARLGALRMRPAFKTVQPEEGEIPVIRTPTPPAPPAGAHAEQEIPPGERPTAPSPGRVPAAPPVKTEPRTGKNLLPAAPTAARTAAEAEALIARVRIQSERVVYNVGGRGAPGEPAGAINVNHEELPGGIPNQVVVRGEEMDRLLPAGSGDEVFSRNLVGDINWDQMARASKAVVKPGGTVTLSPWGGQLGELPQIQAAMENAGFKNVRVEFGAVVKAER
jgi:Domain of unknown function (DUF4157)